MLVHNLKANAELPEPGRFGLRVLQVIVCDHVLIENWMRTKWAHAEACPNPMEVGTQESAIVVPRRSDEALNLVGGPLIAGGKTFIPYVLISMNPAHH